MRLSFKRITTELHLSFLEFHLNLIRDIVSIRCRILRISPHLVIRFIACEYLAQCLLIRHRFEFLNAFRIQIAKRAKQLLSFALFRHLVERSIERIDHDRNGALVRLKLQQLLHHFAGTTTECRGVRIKIFEPITQDGVGDQVNVLLIEDAAKRVHVLIANHARFLKKGVKIFANRRINENGAIEFLEAIVFILKREHCSHAREFAHLIALRQQLQRIILIDESRDEKRDVANHIFVLNVVQKCGQLCRRLIANILKLLDKLAPDTIDNDLRRQFGLHIRSRQHVGKIILLKAQFKVVQTLALHELIVRAIASVRNKTTAKATNNRLQKTVLNVEGH
mmetsp:Transcript_30073/g.49008  ORF Transcript_30073/g.49008 Transcript_30073/m.49008 type:complete len:337 (+) Transcript_30073:292-1302(+)